VEVVEMTVKDLVEWLKKLNQDATVYTYGDDGYYPAEFNDLYAEEDRVYL
jgi:hypothetical protein